MKHFSVFLSVMVLVAAISLGACSFKKKDDLVVAIDEAIAMLEARNHEAFLKRFIDPEDKSTLLRNTTLEELAKKFEGDKADRLLLALKRARDKQPEYSSDNLVATFRFESDQNPDGRNLPALILKKIDGIWYIKN